MAAMGLQAADTQEIKLRNPGITHFATAKGRSLGDNVHENTWEMSLDAIAFISCASASLGEMKVSGPKSRGMLFAGEEHSCEYNIC